MSDTDRQPTRTEKLVAKLYSNNIDPSGVIVNPLYGVARYLDSFVSDDEDVLLLRSQEPTKTNSGRFLIVTPRWFGELEFVADWNHGGRLRLSGTVRGAREVTAVDFTPEAFAYPGSDEQEPELVPAVEVRFPDAAFSIGGEGDYAFGHGAASAQDDLRSLFSILA